jgi:hypothetical protein
VERAAGSLTPAHIGEYTRYAKEKFPSVLDETITWDGFLA